MSAVNIIRQAGCSALVAAAVTVAVDAGVRALPNRVSSALERTNFHGRTVSLAEGLGVIGGVLTASALSSPASHTAAFTAIGALGAVDDIAEPLLAARTGEATEKGLRGHLGALRRGRLTTGAAKALAIPFAAAALTSHHRSITDRGIDTVMIAGGANLINLLDLRPGRALKAATALSGAILLADVARSRCRPTTGPAALPLLAGVLGTVASAAPQDLTERGMLGDAGANILGAAVGAAASRTLSRPVRVGTALSMIALTAASEKISFSSVIENTRLLAAIDSWGRTR